METAIDLVSVTRADLLNWSDALRQFSAVHGMNSNPAGGTSPPDGERPSVFTGCTALLARE
jgi:hypothetical protein